MNRENLKRKVKKRIRDFDLISLIHILSYMGYSMDEILFRSNVSFSSQPSIIESIEFRKPPVENVIVEVNMGLLSSQSTLPSYFFKNLDVENLDNQSFYEFVWFYDHYLIREYIQNLYPEINSSVFSDWEKAKRRYIKMLDLKSPAVIQFLFQLIFPELAAKAEKVSIKRELETMFPRLGITKLGDDAVFGKKVYVPMGGLRVTLFSEEETTTTGEPWAREIENRFYEHIYPFLKTCGLDLEILLVIRSQRSWAKIHDESYLGYDRIRGGKTQYRRIRIFRGHLKG